MVVQACSVHGATGRRPKRLGRSGARGEAEPEMAEWEPNAAAEEGLHGAEEMEAELEDETAGAGDEMATAEAEDEMEAADETADISAEEDSIEPEDREVGRS
jgi:hypothetical protein